MAPGLPTARHGFVLARDARAAGREAELYAAVRAGSLERVRVGVYRHPSPDEQMLPRPRLAAIRYLAQVRAAGMSLQAPVFTSYSAIALAGLPIVGQWPSHVFTMSADTSGSRRGDVRAVARTADVPTIATGGYATTTIEFSLIQLARHATIAAALVATDAALLLSRGRDPRPPLTTVDALRAEHERLLPYHGSRRVEAVITRATSRADGPLETMSRIVIEEFGFPAPVLQQRMDLDELGRTAYLDFFWPEHGVAAEADGRGKYLGDGADATVEAVLDEKAREDAIRARVDGFARWDWSEMWRREPVRARLARAGLPVVRRPVRLIITR
ncbi:type IV toxin-antitoxin system AbiEi family antitoxin domain-containing protein [Agromyces tropicus]